MGPSEINMPPLQLCLENLVVERGSKRVLDHISFTVKNGEAVVLLGPNGSGKTTLLRSLAGLIRPVMGTVSLAENDQKIPLETLLHYVGHLNALKDTLTLEENLSFWANYLGASSPSMVSYAIEAFELDRLRTLPVAYLSAGQKRRACLARLLVASRPLWLLDEPTVSLDKQSVVLVSKQIERHLRSGGLVIMATHDLLGLPQEKKFQIEKGRGAFS